MCTYLLLNLSEDGKVEQKMVARGVVNLLCRLLERRHNRDLCILIATFLARLSVFRENKDQMVRLI